MAKVIGFAEIFKVDEYQRKDGSSGYRCQGFSDEGDVLVFYRPAEEKPQKGTKYNMILAYDNKFSAVVRYQVQK